MLIKKDNITLKRKKFVKKKSTSNFISKKISETNDTITFLNKLNHNLSKTEVKIIMSVLAIVGIILGIIVKNKFISVGFVIILPTAYLEYLNFQKNMIALRIEKQIIKYSVLIKNSYISNHDILKSVKENIDRFEEPIKTLFTEFVKEVEIYNYPVKESINNMNNKIKTPSLQRLTEQLSLCESDRRFDNSLEATTLVLNDRKSFLDKWEYKSKSLINNFILINVVMDLLVLFMLFGYGDIGRKFMEHILFKPMISLLLFLQAILFFQVLRKVNSIKI